jgi:hypothetical protein
MMEKLKRFLRRAGLRLRWIESVAWAIWGLAIALALALGVALAARAFPLLTSSGLALLVALLALAGAGLGLAGAWLIPRSRYRLARILDRRLHLAERLTTAIEIGGRLLVTSPVMATAQLTDTLSAAGRVDLRTALPVRIPRRALLIAAVLAAALLLSLLLPNPQEAILLQRAAVRQAVEEQIETLEEVHERIEEEEGLTPEEREALLQELEEAIEALEENQTTPEEAVSALAEAERALAELQDPGAAELETGLEQASETFSDSELTSELAEALARGDYEAAARELSAFAGDKGEELTREQELELARELAQAAEALNGSDPELAEQLNEAAEAIRQGDTARAQQAIRRAAGEMGAAGQRVERQEALEEALSALQEGREQIAQSGGEQEGGQQASGQQAGQQGTGQQGQQGGGQQGQPGDGQQTQPGHSEDAGTGAPYDELYVPGRIKDEGTDVDVGREGGEDGQPVDDIPLPIPETGWSTVPYEDVYGEYTDQAQSALDESYIPLGMKQYVRDYFSSLEP